MTDTLDIITDAYREGNLIGIGVVPTAAEQAQAITRLNAVVSNVFGNDVGEKLFDWPVGTVVGADSGYNRSWTAYRWTRPQAGARLLVNVGGAQILYLPAAVNDGARLAFVDVGNNISGNPITINANGRLIEDAFEITLDDDGETRQWFYRADLGDWVRIDSLTLDGAMPFPPEFDDVFVTLLAMRLNPRYGRAMMADSGGWMQQCISRFKARYAQTVVTPADLPVLVMSRQSYNPYRDQVGSRTRYGWMS
jgi:hypothetical protein